MESWPVAMNIGGDNISSFATSGPQTFVRPPLYWHNLNQTGEIFGLINS